MKTRFTIPALACIVLLAMSGCIGNQGNVTTSYGTGTILNINNTPCVQLDDINLRITGEGIPALTDSMARALVYYTIDWDKQSSNADATNIYEATFSSIATWRIDRLAPLPDDYVFAYTDTIRAMAKPFVSYKTTDSDKNRITPNLLSVELRLYAANGTVTLMQKNQPADPYYTGMTNDTLIVSYVTNDITTETRDRWYTFELPDYPSNIRNITLLFKSAATVGFTPVPNRDFGGNAYTLTTSFK